MSKKFTEFTDQGTAIEPTDYLVGVVGSDNARAQIKDISKKVWLDSTISTPPWRAGQLWFDQTTGAVTADTGTTDVRTSLGLEIYYPVYNNTGAVITNGTPLMYGGAYISGIASVVEADADSEFVGLGFFGVATHDIPDGTIGRSTAFGAVNGIDTSALSQSPVYIASGGGFTSVPPVYPATRLLVGGATVIDATNGVIGVDAAYLPRTDVSRSDMFTSQGTGAGTFYNFGTYDWSATDANLTQASTSITYGTANRTQAAHIGIVPSAAGVVDTGQVGLRAVGIRDVEELGGGGQTAGYTAIITDDITTLSANTMAETSEKLSGNFTIEFYTVSGSPTAYSLDFNYGFSKYTDFFDRDSTLIGFSCRWWGDANDSGMEIELLPHVSEDWTYAATGFIAGSTPIAKRTDYQQIAGDVDINAGGAWKLTDINRSINSDENEGIIVRITTTANNTFLNSFYDILAVSEELI